MWLTGFDAPCLHTMYADKPHAAVTASCKPSPASIASSKTSPAALSSITWGLADQLKKALTDYTRARKGKPVFDQEKLSPKCSNTTKSALAYSTALTIHNSRPANQGSVSPSSPGHRARLAAG